MKTMKMLLTLCLALCLVLGLATTAFAADPEDLVLEFDENHVVATASISLESGATKTYNVQIKGEMEFSMYAEAVTVVYNGKTYEPVEGEIRFAVAGSPMMPCSFEITNNSETETEYMITIAPPVGTQMNPESVWDPTEILCSIEEGNSQGYYYSLYNRAADGTLSFTASCANEGVEYDVILTNMTDYSMAWLSDSDDNTVAMDIKPGDQIIIQVAVQPDSEWNYPAADITLNGEIIYPLGSQMNPEVVWDLSELSASLEEGNDQGYFYTYFNRAATGTLNFKVTSATEGVEYDVVLTNKQTFAQRTLAADGVDGVVSVEIAPQDEIIIQVVAIPDSNWNIPALDITISGEIAFPKGSQMNPDQLVLGKNSASIEAGDSDGYLYSWIADADGSLTITMNTEAGWTYCVNNLTTSNYGATRWSDDEPALISQTIKVAKGDEIQVLVNTYDPADEWNNPAGEITFTASTTSPASKFTDLKAGKYYSDAMDFMVGNGFMNGTSETEMGPSANTNRAMMATLLYRFAGEPSVEGLNNPFTDVPAGKYYTNAVIWAANEGIVKGTSDTTFAPTKELSRQDLVTMLWRYAGEPKADASALEGFTDAAEVGASRKDAVVWAIENGIITGMTETTIGPKGNAVRGQFATILFRYLQNQ